MTKERRRTSEATRRRHTPPWWVCVIFLVPIAAIVWLRTGDRLGDGGMTNVLTGLLAIVAGIIALAWLALTRRFARKTRLLTLAGVLVVILGLCAVFRIDGFTGSLVPVVSFRWDSANELPTFGAVTLPTESAIDLATTTSHDYPGFLGPRRDLHVPGIHLARDWEARPPRMVWREPIGAGWSAFSVVNGYAATLEERDGQQAVTAYEAETGVLLWTHSWTGAFSHPAGGRGPRSTPIIDDGLVYAQGPLGRLVCLDGARGELVWEVDVPDHLGISREDDAATIVYGRSGSPLIHGDLLIVPGGGTAGGRLANLLAFDKKTGEIVWEGSGHQISYSSPAFGTLGGVEQVLIVNEDTVTGHDVRTGRLLWTHPWAGRSGADPTASQAVPLPPDRVFVSRGYGYGSALLQLDAREDGTFDVTQRWRHARSLRTKYTNVLIRDGHAYGLSDGILECVELESGTRVWKGGRYGHGQILGVGDLMLVLSEDGEVFLVDPRPDRTNDVLGSFEGIDGLTWNNLALYGDLLLIRNGHEAAAYRLPLAEG